jgi:hypothetical protein
MYVRQWQNKLRNYFKISKHFLNLSTILAALFDKIGFRPEIVVQNYT